VKKSSYGEQDYAFGQLMLTLRMAIGLTQAGLAEKLRVSRHAIGGWEAGQSYPKANHLKAFIALGLQQRVFVAGREAEEIRTLWRAAHQKILLDELWLQELLTQQASPLMPVAVERPNDTDHGGEKPRVDWGDALDVPTFYGRETELALLDQWVVKERCRVVSVLGMGGIGKSALTVTFMHWVATQFEVVIWRSLRDAPACEALLDECLQVLAPQSSNLESVSLEQRINLLLEHLRTRRTLLVLDNLEMLLDEGAGRMRPGSEGYARLVQRIGETAHQSCLLLTSREKLADLVPLEGSRSSVRALRLAGLDAHAGAQLLAEKDVMSSPLDRVRLVEVYQGNPLALKIVAQTIVELFGGDIAPFLEQGEVVFGGVRKLLVDQYARLTGLEQIVVCWLAIMREPMTLSELRALFVTPKPTQKLLETVDGLLRRSLIESGQYSGSFTLQSVVLEYVTSQFIAEASRELEQGHLTYLIEYGLVQAKAKDYIRQTQERLLLAPLLVHLQRVVQQYADVEAQVSTLLDEIRRWTQRSQGYGPANLVVLLRMLRGNLRGLDLSRLALRGVSLQGVEMQDARLSGAALQDCVFTEPIDAIVAITISRDGQYWAVANRRGEVRIWKEAGQTLHRVWQAHIASVPALAFSPDGRTLASVSWDNTIKLWDVSSGTLLWTGWQTGGINCVAFAPNGHMLASCGDDTLVHLWDARSGTKVQTLAGQGSAVYLLAWSPNGRLLAGSCFDRNIWVWEPRKAEPDAQGQRLAGDTRWVAGLAFSPDSAQLVCASLDGTIKRWDITSGDCLQTFSQQTNLVHSVVWSPNGYMLASAGFDQTIWLWNLKEGRVQAILHGHSAVIYAIAFTPDSRTLLSGSDDGTLRVWDVKNGQCLRMIGGYVTTLFDIDWSPDGTQLASVGADMLVTIWDEIGATAPRVLSGHHWPIQGVSWSPDGTLLASVGNSIRLWDTATGVCLQVLQDSDEVYTVFQSVAWSPNGHLLACGSRLRGVQMWDMTTRTRLWVGSTPPIEIRRVAWNPDGTRLVSGGGDGYIYMWDGRDGTLLLHLAGHNGAITSVAWSPDGKRLASGGGGREGGELFVWEAHSGERMRVMVGHPGLVYAVAWSPNGEMVMSGGSDGRLRWWQVDSGACARVQEAHQGTVHALKVSPDGTKLVSCGNDGAIVLWDVQSGERLQTLRRDRPYERLNITGIRGVTEVQKASLRAMGAVEEMVT
jgi:WD40 repeat protein/transcriptional regulator with XRE-family HTH domain